MSDLLSAGLIFLALVAAALGALLVHGRLPARFRDEDTARVIGAVTGLFVVMTSLALSLMLSQARSTLSATDTSVHTLATDAILLDRALAHYGLQAGPARMLLLAYVTHAARTDEPPAPGPAEQVERGQERALAAVGDAIDALTPADPAQADLQRDLEAQFQALVRVRWTILQQADGTTPTPFVVLVATWLVLIFGSFGYRSPRNLAVVGTLVLAAALVAATFYLMLDMDAPLTGTLQVSPAPLERAIAEMSR